LGTVHERHAMLAMNAFYWGLRLTQPCAAEMQHYDGGCWKTTTSPPRRSA
jgi:hypothetical protein